jgi:hypothetical protein
MEQNNRTALHEAARFVGFSLYVGADKIGMLSGLDVTDAPDTAPAPAGKIAIYQTRLWPLAKSSFAAWPPTTFTSGEADSLSWLEDATDGSEDWHGITAQTMHPVFEVVA